MHELRQHDDSAPGGHMTYLLPILVTIGMLTVIYLLPSLESLYVR